MVGYAVAVRYLVVIVGLFFSLFESSAEAETAAKGESSIEAESPTTRSSGTEISPSSGASVCDESPDRGLHGVERALGGSAVAAVARSLDDTS